MEFPQRVLLPFLQPMLTNSMSHLAAFAEVGARVAPPNPKGNKGSEDDPSLLLQDDAVQNVDWVIEGVEELDADAHRHMLTFYTNLKDWYRQRDYTSVLLTKAGYDERVAFGMFLIEGGDCRSGFMAGTSTAYKWAKKYHVVTVGEESKVLVLCPEENHQKKRRKGVVHVESMRLEDLQQPTYAERLFADLWKIHQEDHCKGNTLFTCARDCHGNITREV